MRRRLMLKSSAGVSPVLPAEYQQVEWIRCDANSYFITSTYPSADIKISADAAFGIISLNNVAIFSCGAQNYNGNLWYIAYQNWTTKWVARCDGASNVNTLGEADTNRHLFTIDAKNNIFSIDSLSASLPFNQHVPTSYPIRLGINVGGNTSCAATIYRFWEEINDQLSANFLPCYRKADNVIGLYDTISDNFITNAGTGTITKGADV